MSFRAFVGFLVVLVVVLVPVATVHAQTWTQLTPATSPSARSYHAMAYDVARQKIILFGGQGSGGGPLNDTWEWDGSSWIQRSPATSPSPRFAHAMAYDSTRQKIVLFGGTDGQNRPTDTWVWDGSDWVLHAPTGPTPRVGFAMAFDVVRQRIVIFGGNYGGTGQLDDTWEWEGMSWVQRFPVTKPSARQVPAMTYDGASQKIVLFGGWGGGFQNDTWEWDGNNWFRRTPAVSPNGRSSHAMVYDALHQKVVLFGGDNGGGNCSTCPLNDTWVWDGSNWDQPLLVIRPGNRREHAMVFDAVGQRIIVFGGYAGGSLSDTWEYRTGPPPPPPASYSAFGSACVGTNGLPALVPNQLPRIGESFSVILSRLPPMSSGMLCTGTSRDRWGQTPLPLDLTPYGFTGCSCYITVESVHAIPDTGPFGAVIMGVPIENDPGLIGLQFFNQAAFLDPGANPGGIVFTNAGEGVIGR